MKIINKKDLSVFGRLGVLRKLRADHGYLRSSKSLFTAIIGANEFECQIQRERIECQMN